MIGLPCYHHATRYIGRYRGNLVSPDFDVWETVAPSTERGFSMMAFQEGVLSNGQMPSNSSARAGGSRDVNIAD